MLVSLLLAVAAPCVAGDSPADLRRIAAGDPSCDGLKAKVPDRAVSTREQARVKAHFDKELFDGPSARWQFDGVKGGSLICGTVNAKNRLGAYVGWNGFIYDLKDGTGSIFDDDKRAWLFATLCHGAKP